MKVTGTGMVGASLLGAAGCDLTERKRNKRPGGEAGPNVVLVIIDSLRRDHVGAYGNDWMQTPNLDALANESLRFTRPYPESIPTLCARRAIHTGVRTWPFKNWHPTKGDDIGLWGWQPIPNEQTTLAEMTRAAGYGTYFVTDTLHQYKASMNYHRGFDSFDFIRGQTSDHFKPNWTYPPEKFETALFKGTGELEYSLRQYFANVQTRQGEEDWFAPQVFTRASEVLETVSEGGPFFMTVDCYDPHEPWDPPEEYVKMYDEPYDGKEPYWVLSGPNTYLDDRQVQRMKARYSGELTMMDRWLGRFMDKMEELNLFENTLLIVISDHGVAHGEHGLVGKVPRGLYPELTDIVFLMRHPEGKRAGDTSDYYASTHDVAPTILGFLGVEPLQPMEGQDLLVLMDGKQPNPRPHFTLGYHNQAWCRDENYAMFCRHDGKQAKLYDLRTDPDMLQDVAGRHPGIARRMFEEYVIKDAGGPLPSY